jgi:single-stranded-DNA-specific exonuclease
MATENSGVSEVHCEQDWTQRPLSQEAVVTLVRKLAVSPWLARLLVGRGIESPTEAYACLKPESQPYHDPYPLSGLDPFLHRIEQAIKGRHKVIIHGDYDADGITSAAIMQFALSRVGLEPEVFLPNRFEGGYGIKAEWVKEQKEAGFDLIVTTDCGSSAEEACHMASQAGIDLLITDHHTPNPEMKGALAHINPHLPGCKYPFKQLSGAGVAFKLAQALAAFVPPSFQSKYREDLPVDLAMIGAIADVMPLIDENRRIVVDGLDRVRTRPSPGLRALLEAARTAPEGVTVETVAFQIAPRLNAAGRLRSPQLAFDLLTSSDPVRIAELTKELEKTNEERKKLGAKATEEALARLRLHPQEGVVVMCDPEWHRGILGILAARLMETTGLPVFVACADGDLAHGSARVPFGFNAARILEAASEFTEAGGGHAGAAGFTVRLAVWKDFERAVRTAVLDHGIEAAAPEFLLDGFLVPGIGLVDVLREVSQLEPFGEGFPAPLFAVCRFEGKGRYALFGEGHLKINLGTVKEPLEAVGFKMAEWSRDLDQKPVDLAIEYGENHWNGKTTIRPKIVAIRPALKESAEVPRHEEVTRFCANEGLSRLVLWDARGGTPADVAGCLRIGYGPEWRTWWKDLVPGAEPTWKARVWERFTALPRGIWPGNCSTGYGGEIPQEWNGEMVEILWPPLRKADRSWLRSVLASAGGESLVRLVYSTEMVEEWLDVSRAEPTRENVALVYRAIEKETSLQDLLALPLKPVTQGLCLEILADLALVTLEGEVVRRNSSPMKRDLSESEFLRNWGKHFQSLEAWACQANTRPITELLRKWLQD